MPRRLVPGLYFADDYTVRRADSFADDDVGQILTPAESRPVVFVCDERGYYYALALPGGK